MTAENEEMARKAQVRQASIVIAVAMLAWMGLSFLGGQLGLPVRYAFLIDMACIAALVWALWVMIRVRRANARSDGGEG